MQNTDPLRHQVVRNLASSCFGPNLIDSFAHFGSNDVHCGQFALNERRKGWLLSLDRNPAPLVAHLEQLKSTRLGLYFEALWLFFLQHDPDYEVLANNLLVYKDRRTLGEFDLIYRDKCRNRVIHLELALKYYLSDPASHMPYAARDWLGPNNIDRLDLKVKHLLEHQTHLSDTPQALSLLGSLGIGDIEKQVVIKGQLFYHMPGFNTAPPLPSDSAYLAPQHKAAQWCYYGTNRTTISQLPRCMIVDRLDWLSSIDLLEDERQAIDGEQLTTHLDNYFAQYDRPIMVATVKDSRIGLCEDKRFFLAPDGWPPSTGR